ncbi:MAG TPA: rhomboid family intramembrane serine protease [Chryseolinea sp.]|nr:rhomboid family intramembrane serine protease [Chryseolinea sp.]HPH45709.1 rhomboid family intramembrane serine protease [Chryseolinea sp.]HPM29737.1 rhomboid family intramembrane serine protease [Chryseolinea sp.]
METSSIAGLCILIATVIISYQGINDIYFLDRYSFKINAILIHKDYKRLVSSGFLHADWAHLVFNMMTFYSFSSSLEMTIGIPRFLAIYFGSLLGGNLLALYIHRNDNRYSAVGASGAVSGLVYAAIALFPGMELGLFFLPLSIPSWLFGLLYTLYTLYGIKSQHDNIGHEAHLGGGLIGLIAAIAMYPYVLQTNYLPILLIVIPSSVFLYLVITRPGFLSR